MGQTLTHGIYLPDEGERNCYNGLAANWQILDTSVGTIAAHTAALAGKAPAVHTHTKSDITDFPVYGNTAGTICEGNDSRLSDARTPVAHTHTKSDVTDLLNSNFIPSANNSYNLGSSSYQWNNLYAKNYYYNGVAFTDKFVTTDTAQTISVQKKFTVGFSLKNTAVTSHTTAPSSETNSKFLFLDGNDRYWGSYNFYWLTDGTTETRLQHTNYSTSGDQGWWQLAFGATKDFNNVYFKPLSNATINLGDSTHKWKTLNGINPGALSFPSSDSADYIDLSSNLNTNAEYLYTAPYDGWLCLYVNVNEFYTENAIGLYRSDTSANSHQWAKSVTAALNLYKQNRYQGSVMLPVESGKKYICYISLNANATIHSKYLFFYKNKGNV